MFISHDQFHFPSSRLSSLSSPSSKFSLSLVYFPNDYIILNTSDFFVISIQFFYHHCHEVFRFLYIFFYFKVKNIFSPTLNLLSFPMIGLCVHFLTTSMECNKRIHRKRKKEKRKSKIKCNSFNSKFLQKTDHWPSIVNVDL